MSDQFTTLLYNYIRDIFMQLQAEKFPLSRVHYVIPSLIVTIIVFEVVILLLLYTNWSFDQLCECHALWPLAVTFSLSVYTYKHFCRNTKLITNYKYTCPQRTIPTTAVLKRHAIWKWIKENIIVTWSELQRQCYTTKVLYIHAYEPLLLDWKKCDRLTCPYTLLHIHAPWCKCMDFKPQTMDDW